jgi:hypothetical protein
MQIPGKGLFSRAVTNSLVIPVLVLSVGVVFLAFDVLISDSRPTVKSIALIAGSISYLLFRNRISSNLNFVFPARPTISLLSPFVLNLIFFSLFSYTLFIAVTADVYAIPLSYFMLTAAMCVTIVLDIFLMPQESKSYTYIILVKIIATSLLLIAIPHYFFPNIGQDFWEHSTLVSRILSESHIPLAGYEYYRDFLAMHFVVAAVKAVTTLNIQVSMMSIGLFQVMGLLSLFCIGRAVFNNKIALLGALFAGVSGAFIFWGYYIIPMSLGIGLIPVLIFLRLKSSKSDKKRTFTIFWLLISAIIIYTHTIAGLIFVIILVSMYLADKFIHFRSGKGLATGLAYSTPVLFFVALLGYWMYCTVHRLTPISRANSS